MRETEEAAWKAAEELLRPVSDTAVAYLAEQLKQSPNNYLVEPGGAASALHDLLRQVEEDGARNGVRLNGTRRDNLEVAPNLWAGLRLLRPGRTLTLVGDPVSAAARLQEYAAMGVDTFILNNTPHLDQAKNFAKLVFPLLPLDHGWEVPGSGTASIPGVKRTSDVPDRFRPVSLAPDGFTSANSKSEEVVSAG